jgi:hypothetical protein
MMDISFKSIKSLSQKIIKKEENGNLKWHEDVTAVEKGKSVSSAIYSLIGSITLIGIAVILTLLLSLLN